MDIAFAHKAAHQAIVNAKRVLLVSHPNPDGDTLAAAAAMLLVCRRRGITADYYCRDAVPEQYAHMPGTEALASDPSIFTTHPYDVLAVFDAGDLRFAGIVDLVPLMQKRPVIIDFDHHVTNERFGDINVVDVGASSTAEVVHDFLRLNGEPISREMASGLLTGILFDTGNFSNPATTHGSLGAAGDLLLHGAKIHEASNRLTRNKPLSALRLWGRALSRIKHDPTSGVASTAVFLDDVIDEGADPEHIEGLSNFLNTFLDAPVTLVLKELPDGKVKGSYRSASDVDVAAIAKSHGGGGHKKAAGFTVSGKIVEKDNGWHFA
jgi:bifunctional oligoribonuclease and PAP phosphatase NrnA